MADVVTGEAVVVDVRIAKLGTRAVALLIDLLVQFSVLVGGIIAVIAAERVLDEALLGAIVLTLLVLTIVGYPAILETLTRGRTLGKLALGLRVVGDDGSPERFRQALLRALAGFVEIWLLQGSVALISSLLSDKGKRLGDFFAGTIVIAERVPVRPSAVAQMPPGLGRWASTLELSTLPVEVTTTARNYLSRWYQLSPAARTQMGQRIAATVAGYVSPPPPPGVSPEAYLSAVLAERRRREAARLAARQQQDRQPLNPQPYGPPPAVPQHTAPSHDAPDQQGTSDFAPPF